MQIQLMSFLSSKCVAVQFATCTPQINRLTSFAETHFYFMQEKINK